MWLKWSTLACHPERQRRISLPRVETLAHTQVAKSAYDSNHVQVI